jgi:hypothetical protein
MFSFLCREYYGQNIAYRRQQAGNLLQQFYKLMHTLEKLTAYPWKAQLMLYSAAHNVHTLPGTM